MFEGVLGMLAFFTTALAVLVSDILLILDLLKKRKNRVRKVGRFLLIWLGAYILLVAGFSLASRPQYLQVDSERCFDEMCFSIQDIKHSATLGQGSDTVVADGEYIIVTVNLRNDAKRTAQRPAFLDLYVIDAGGKRYTQIVDPDPMDGIPVGAMVNANELWRQPIPARETQSRTIAFDLPGDIQQPGLVVYENAGPISVFIIDDENSPFHAKTLFLLDS